ncbi:MAG: hypothetical protein AAGI52_17455 [Bacteroidota bacterium]
MDEILLYLLFVVVYFVLGGIRRRNQKRQQQRAPKIPGAEQAPSGEERAPTPFEQFVEQMEEAMREAAGEPPREPEPEPIEVKAQEAPPPPALPIPTKRPVTSVGGRTEPEFRDLGSFQAETAFESSWESPHERQGFGLDQPFSEERFEHLARGRDITEHDHAPLFTPPPARSSRTERWRRQLADPKQAQDALVLKEIFSGPWSPRRPKRMHD